MRKKLFFLFVVSVLMSLQIWAVPADPTPITIKQPNGKTLTFILQGDERISWSKTLDNYSLLYNPNGNLVYAILDENGDMVPSDVLACNKEERSREEIEFLEDIKPGLFFSQKQIDKRKQRFHQPEIEQQKIEAKQESKKKDGTISSKTGSARHQIGTKKMLILLVEFQDEDFNYTQQDFIDKYEGVDSVIDGSGSLKEYYYDCSRGRLELEFTVIGPLKLSENKAYYGGQGQNVHDIRPREMAAEAVALAADSVNYIDYDTDQDGYVDFVHVVYAGTGQSSSGNANDIWPHSWVFPHNTEEDGMLFRRYSCSNERQVNGNSSGVGTAAHEIGHDLGLPDFYDTDYYGSGGKSVTLRSWETMDAGNYNNDGYTPPLMNSYSAYHLGWIDSLIVLDSETFCMTEKLGKTNHLYAVKLSETETLYIENRKKTEWDEYVYGEGMLIYQVDSLLMQDWWDYRTNNVNINPDNRGFFIVPSTGVNNDAITKRATFPGDKKNHSFTENSPASPALKDGTPINKPITHIEYINDSLITFNFMSSLPQVLNVGMDPYFPIMDNQAKVHAHIVYSAGQEIIEKGMMWSIDSTNILNYDFYQKQYNEEDEDEFETILINLVAGERIYYRPFVATENGTDLGEIKSFNAYGETIFGLEDIEKTSTNIYPNPATDVLNISNLDFGDKIIITDVLASEIMRVESVKQENLRLDISSLNTGVYFVRIISGDESSVRKLIVR